MISKRVRTVYEVIVFSLMCAALWYTFNHKITLFASDVVSVQRAYPVGSVYKGTKHQFIFEFVKNRNDCANPTIKRTLINLDTGSTVRVFDDLESVVQYPETEKDSVDKISVKIGIPENWSGERNVIVSDLCYKCPVYMDGDPQAMGVAREEKICRSFSTERFSVR